MYNILFCKTSLINYLVSLTISAQSKYIQLALRCRLYLPYRLHLPIRRHNRTGDVRTELGDELGGCVAVVC